MLLEICGGHVGVGAEGITLIITGGLRTESDFVKALALGADGIPISHSTIQTIGCLGMRACHSNNCPVGIATKKKGLRARLIVEESAQRLANFFAASTELMQVLARAGGYGHLRDVTIRDFTTWNCDTSDLTGVRFGGVGTPQA
jgi:glutamate synthase domain-containing protein 2